MKLAHTHAVCLQLLAPTTLPTPPTGRTGKAAPTAWSRTWWKPTAPSRALASGPCSRAPTATHRTTTLPSPPTGRTGKAAPTAWSRMWWKAMAPLRATASTPGSWAPTATLTRIRPKRARTVQAPTKTMVRASLRPTDVSYFLATFPFI